MVLQMQEEGSLEDAGKQAGKLGVIESHAMDERAPRTLYRLHL